MPYRVSTFPILPSLSFQSPDLAQCPIGQSDSLESARQEFQSPDLAQCPIGVNGVVISRIYMFQSPDLAQCPIGRHMDRVQAEMRFNRLIWRNAL